MSVTLASVISLITWSRFLPFKYIYSANNGENTPVLDDGTEGDTTAAEEYEKRPFIFSSQLSSDK
jgi:hypothetical protein